MNDNKPFILNYRRAYVFHHALFTVIYSKKENPKHKYYRTLCTRTNQIVWDSNNRETYLSFIKMRINMIAPWSVLLGASPTDTSAIWAAELTCGTAEGRFCHVRHGAGGGRKSCPSSNSSRSSSCVLVSDAEVGLYLVEWKEDYSASDSRGCLQENCLPWIMGT